MINYRTIFNPNYIPICLSFILIIITLIIFLEKDYLSSIKKISKTILLSSTITFIIGLILNIFIKYLLITNYKILIEIITNNLIKNIYLYSITLIFISILTQIIINLQNKYLIN